MVLLVLLVEEQVVWMKTTGTVGVMMIVLREYVEWRRGHGMVLLVLLVEEHAVWMKTTDMVGLVVIVLRVYVVWRRGMAWCCWWRNRLCV
jgi:hypothetical protein